MRKVGPIPQLGFGTWKRAGEDGAAAVLQALQAGYRHIDTASAYGNEEDVGEAITRSGIARSELFITTKAWPDDFGPGQVVRSARDSLSRLGLQQVDLFLLHWPTSKFDVTDYVRQLAEVQDKGLARHIGVSNFNRTYLDKAIAVLGADRITTNQIEIHPLFQNRAMVSYTRDKGISTTAYTPLARGAINSNETILRIAATHNATAGQVALAFLMAEGHVVIPTSSSPARMAENLSSQSVTLSSQDIADLRYVDQNRRLVTGSFAPDWNA